MLTFTSSEALKPPYSVLVDTNFLSHTIQRKLPLLESMMGESVLMMGYLCSGPLVISSGRVTLSQYHALSKLRNYRTMVLISESGNRN